jgi:hypothetical protein
VAALGFAGWLLAAIGLISLGFRKDGKVLSPAFGWTLFLGVGYVVWIVGLIRA